MTCIEKKAISEAQFNLKLWLLYMNDVSEGRFDKNEFFKIQLHLSSGPMHPTDIKIQHTIYEKSTLMYRYLNAQNGIQNGTGIKDILTDS